MGTPELGRQGSGAKNIGTGTGAIHVTRRFLSSAVVVLALVALGAYVLAGFSTVPFHPDEATWIFMSSDLDTLLQGRVGALCYEPGVPLNGRVIERLLTPGLPRYVIAVANFLFGVPPSTVRADWNWSLSWQENAAAGAVPGARALFTARLPMALAVVLALVLVFAIGKVLAGRWAGLLAAFAFGSNALVLLHGRRAMSEGLLLLTTTLAVWAAMRWATRRAVKGGALGLAGAAKHSGFAVLPVSLVSLLWGSESRTQPASAGEKAPKPLGSAPVWGRVAIGAAIMVACSLVVFGLFNPVGWCHPLGAVSAALAERAGLLTDQTQMISQAIPVEVVLTPRSRLAAFINQTFFAPPAFWDIPNYAKQTARQEQAYLAGIWGGLPRSIGLGIAELFLALLGLAYSLLILAGPWLRRDNAKREGKAACRAMLLFLLWAGSTSVAILVAVPIQWQRYYVPLLPETSLLEALGLVMLAKFAAAIFQRRDQGVG
ncbi:MAG: hypothetical protein ABSG98_12495 [Anaerolineales bacterium]|jgi:hypothetical protein